MERGKAQAENSRDGCCKKKAHGRECEVRGPVSAKGIRGI